MFSAVADECYQNMFTTEKFYNICLGKSSEKIFENLKIRKRKKKFDFEKDGGKIYIFQLQFFKNFFFFKYSYV